MNTTKSLEELEDDNWPNIHFPTDMIKRCFELRKVPINKLEIEDLRLLIGQNIGLVFLVPLAAEVLSKNILAEGNYYPGDLLKNVLDVSADFWKSNEAYWNKLNLIFKNNINKIKQANIINDTIRHSLLKGIANFEILLLHKRPN